MMCANLDILGRWAVSSDGRRLAVDGPPGNPGVHLIDLASGVDTVLGHKGTEIPGYGLESFSPDSRILAVAENGAGRPLGVQLWDVEGCRPGPFLPGECSRATFSVDGRRLVVKLMPQRPNDRVEPYVVWDTVTGRELARLGMPSCASVATFTPDGAGLITIDGTPPEDGVPERCTCVDFANGRVRWSFAIFGRCDPIDGGRRLITIGDNPETSTNEVTVRDSDDGHIISNAPFDSNNGISAIAPNGLTWVASSTAPIGMDVYWTWLSDHGLPGPPPSQSPHLDLRDVATGRRILVMPEPLNSSLDYSADGKTLAILNETGDLTIWDIPPRKPLGWFALAAAILALPLTGLAWRRSRRLRSLAGITL
jgi:hypothetical protein